MLKVSKEKTGFTEQDLKVSKYLETLSFEERLVWRKQEVKKYRVGQPVKFVMGGPFGKWSYGVVIDIKDYYVGVRDLNGCSVAAPPDPQSGLEQITNEELIAAISQNFIE